MNKTNLEALSEAIMRYSGYSEPGSDLWIARNPGGLRAFSPRHHRDANGNRVFGSLLDGFQALMFDVELKVSGCSKSNLQPHNNLSDLAVSLGKEFMLGDAWAKFLRKALHDETITRRTALEYFMRDGE